MESDGHGVVASRRQRGGAVDAHSDSAVSPLQHVGRGRALHLVAVRVRLRRTLAPCAVVSKTFGPRRRQTHLNTPNAQKSSKCAPHRVHPWSHLARSPMLPSPGPRRLGALAECSLGRGRVAP